MTRHYFYNYALASSRIRSFPVTFDLSAELEAAIVKTALTDLKVSGNVFITWLKSGMHKNQNKGKVRYM